MQIRSKLMAVEIQGKEMQNAIGITIVFDIVTSIGLYFISDYDQASSGTHLKDDYSHISFYTSLVSSSSSLVVMLSLSLFSLLMRKPTNARSMCAFSRCFASCSSSTTTCTRRSLSAHPSH